MRGPCHLFVKRCLQLVKNVFRNILGMMRCIVESCTRLTPKVSRALRTEKGSEFLRDWSEIRLPQILLTY